MEDNNKNLETVKKEFENALYLPGEASEEDKPLNDGGIFKKALNGE